jgi:D-amino-acid dehydrogenase
VRFVAHAREHRADRAALGISGRALRELREETGIRYDAVTRGILNYYTEQDEFENAIEGARIMREYGVERAVKTVDEAIAIEGALANARDKIVGATYAASDESGDRASLHEESRALAAGRGVSFLYGRSIQRLRASEGPSGRRRGEVGGGRDETLTADAYVVALGSYSPLLTRPIGIDLPIYPLKGYSASIEVVDPARAPTVSLTDEAAKIVMSRWETACGWRARRSSRATRRS